MAISRNHRGASSSSSMWLVLLFAGCAVLQSVNGAGSGACKTIPENDKSMTQDERCCTTPMVFANATLDECWKGVSDSGKLEPEKACEFSNCIMKKHKFVKANGQLDGDQIRTYLKEQLETTPEWKTLMEKVVLEECGPMIEKGREDIKKVMQQFVGQCDPMNGVLITCALGKVHANCPSADWNDSKLCNEFKSYFSKCTDTLENMNEMFLAFEAKKIADGGR
ncbi:general odorant-binding protein 68-like [Anopheles aquasalis]|uniref:general odorant-binding protein 68-like n=1 Tax=Anopheles aquasalis TaxID=42839 RepID=UPI00215B212C|nr:general odorant-binding protein 68-like [Anopheles aquasalis]